MASVFQTLMQAEHLSLARDTSQGSHSKAPLISAAFLDLYFEVGPVIAAHIDTVAEWRCWFLLSFLLAMIWETGPGNSAGPTKYTARLSAWFKTSATASLLFAFPAVVRLNGHSWSAEVLCVCTASNTMGMTLGWPYHGAVHSPSQAHTARSASGIKTHGRRLPAEPFDSNFQLWTVTQE